MAIKRGTIKNRRPESKINPNSLPNSYLFAANALQIMSERGGSAGSIVVGKYKNYNYKLIYGLVMNAGKNIKIIKKIIHETKLSKKVAENNPFVLEILVGDLLFGKGLKAIEQSTTAASILKHKDDIIKQQNELKKQFAIDQNIAAKYVRINHLKGTTDVVLSQLKSNGFSEVEYQKEKIKFKKFANKFKSMESNQFLQDFHFPDDLLIMKNEGANKLKQLDVFKRKRVLLQDKASFMAVAAMDIKPNMTIIDACCAPGSKTALIADKMCNKGKILGYDKSKERLISTKHLLKTYGVTCAKLEVQDFSKVKLNRLLKTSNITKFDCILLDPSCSGSGISSRVDYKKTDQEPGRLKKLQAFQVSLLKHVLKSNATKRVVYCTCSNNVEENEQVIEMALNESGAKDNWEIIDILPYWPERGSENYEFGIKCVRSSSTNLTNGFFIARLDLKTNVLPLDNNKEDE